MALVVSGRLKHRRLKPAQVRAALERHLPGLVVSSPDFSLSRAQCNVAFFCNTTSTLDFTVTVSGSSPAAPAAVAILVRETDILAETIRQALSTRLRRAKLEFCLLEDDRSKSGLLTWDPSTPLKSSAAVASYIICGGLLVLAAFLVKGQMELPPSDTRDYNVISLLLAIILPAIAVPLPFLFEQLSSRGAGNWIFSQKGGN